jgi:hypothetical protein
MKFMKRGTIFFLSLLILTMIIPDISAVDISFSKEAYQPEETLQAEITGSFISLKKENILIYHESTPRPEPVLNDLTKKNNRYYFYAVLPNKEGNFFLHIYGTQYIRQGELTTETITRNFSVSRTNQPALSIYPGFILTDEDFSVNVKSLYGNPDITAEFEATGETKNLSLIEYVDRDIGFSIAGTDTDTANLKIDSYNIPVFIFKQPEEIDGVITVEKISELDFVPSELDAVISPGEDYFFQIYVENTGEKNLTSIKLSTELEGVKIQPESISSLKTNESSLINITIKLPSDAEERISDRITVSFDGKSAALPLTFNIATREEEIDLGGTSITEVLSCSDIGLICPADTKCEGGTTASLEGSCCLGECLSSKTSRLPLTIGLILVLVVLVIIGFFYWRARQKQKPKSTQEILKEKAKKYKERMEPSEEVKGHLKKN